MKSIAIFVINELNPIVSNVIIENEKTSQIYFVL